MTAAPKRKSLSKNDTYILAKIFDPESAPDSHPTILPYSPPSPLESSILQRERAAISSLNVPSPSPAIIQTCISSLSVLISDHPTRASLYANRAQAKRLLHGVDIFNREVGESGLLQDLCEAIRLASPARPGDAVSQEQARVLSAAYTHRGFLLMKATRGMREGDMKAVIGLTNIQDAQGSSLGAEGGDQGKVEKGMEITKNQLEEVASRDFWWGGRYGNEDAKRVAVATNPYAKVCGNIVREALQREIRGGIEI